MLEVDAIKIQGKDQGAGPINAKRCLTEAWSTEEEGEGGGSEEMEV